jgi:hypothetical protein
VPEHACDERTDQPDASPVAGARRMRGEGVAHYRAVVSQKEMKALSIERDAFHGDWNDVIRPRPAPP